MSEYGRMEGWNGGRMEDGKGGRVEGWILDFLGEFLNLSEPGFTGLEGLPR